MDSGLIGLPSASHFAQLPREIRAYLGSLYDSALASSGETSRHLDPTLTSFLRRAFALRKTSQFRKQSSRDHSADVAPDVRPPGRLRWQALLLDSHYRSSVSNWWTAASPGDRQRTAEMRGEWLLRTIPTELCLPRQVWFIAVRLRLGLSVLPAFASLGLPDVALSTCGHVGHKRACNHTLDTHGYHALTCHTGGWLIARHNRIRDF